VRRLLKEQFKRVLRRFGYEVRITRTGRARRPAVDGFSPSFRPYAVKVPPAPAGAPRVLHVIGNFYTGGSPRLVVDLIERLGDRLAQTVLTRDVPSPPAYVAAEIDVRSWLTTPDEALAAIERSKPDLVHVHYLGPAFSGIEVGDWQWFTNVMRALERSGRTVIENVNIPIAPYVSDAVGCYVFVSDYVRERFGYPHLRSVTIYPGSDVQTFRRDGDLPDDCVGMVYRLQGDKLGPQAIDPFVEIVRRRPQTRALIVGGGAFLRRYRDAVAAAGLEGRFTFTGYVAYDDLRAYLERLSVFLAPVHTESFGHVVPLAMSMGIPVAAYDVGALPEILGDPSMLAPAGDAGAMAEIVCKLLDDRPRMVSLGTANRERAVERFSVDAMAQRYAALYDEVLSEKRRVQAPRS
jgi:glycosyltransferase involved in cell wall biosynthesis